ncbi:MAG TPA: hypothetical protein VGI92_12240 [Gemmatimonadales bacterium]|jgi:hypothetical protein
MMRRVVLALAAATLALLVDGCGHDDPYAVGGPPPPNAPQTIGPLQQLTFDIDGDLAPTFLPGDSLLAFSWILPGASDQDRCLAFYRLAAARIRNLRCIGGDTRHDTTNVILSSAESPGGRLAYVVQHGPPTFPLSAGALYIGNDSDTTGAVPVLSIPFSSDSFTPLTNIEQLNWKDEQTLVFLGVLMNPPLSYMESTPQVIDVLVLGSGAPVRTQVPNSLGATSVAIDPADGQAYATFANDSLVYAIDLTTGARTTVLNLAAFSVPRDIRVEGHRLVAVVQGRRFTMLLPSLAIIPVDEGGDLLWKDLTDSLPPTLITNAGIVRTPPASGGADRWFRHLILSRDGKTLVAEGFPVAYRVKGGGTPPPLDTVVTKKSDLYLLRLP